MDIQTSPDPVARARELGAEIAAAADEIERTRRIPAALLTRLHAPRFCLRRYRGAPIFRDGDILNEGVRTCIRLWSSRPRLL